MNTDITWFFSTPSYFKPYECSLKLRDPGATTCTGDASMYGSITDLSNVILKMKTDTVFGWKEFCVECKTCYNTVRKSNFFKV